MTSEGRFGLAAAGAMSIAAAIWFASGWIADPPDSTCGSAWRLDIWPDRTGCQTAMLLRVGVSLLVAGLGVALLAKSARASFGHRWLLPLSASAVIAALVVNEFVRDGGVFG